MGARGGARVAEVSLPGGERPGGCDARAAVPAERSGPGVAAVVFSVEQHSRRGAADAGGTGAVDGPGGARAAGAAAARRSPLRGTGVGIRRAVGGGAGTPGGGAQSRS